MRITSRSVGWRRVYGLACLAGVVAVAFGSATTLGAAKPRVIVLTDITNEPDDEQSMVRFLCYANQFDVEGLVATTSCWLRHRIAPEKIRERITAYGKVRPNLVKHAPGYPPADRLQRMVKSGLPVFGMKGVGRGQDSEGSRHIVRVVDKADGRPVWVCIWGGRQLSRSSTVGR